MIIMKRRKLNVFYLFIKYAFYLLLLFSGFYFYVTAETCHKNRRLFSFSLILYPIISIMDSLCIALGCTPITYIPPECNISNGGDGSSCLCAFLVIPQGRAVYKPRDQ